MSVGFYHWALFMTPFRIRFCRKFKLNYGKRAAAAAAGLHRLTKDFSFHFSSILSIFGCALLPPLLSNIEMTMLMLSLTFQKATSHLHESKVNKKWHEYECQHSCSSLTTLSTPAVTFSLWSFSHKSHFDSTLSTEETFVAFIFKDVAHVNTFLYVEIEN